MIVEFKLELKDYLKLNYSTARFNMFILFWIGSMLVLRPVLFCFGKYHGYTEFPYDIFFIGLLMIFFLPVSLWFILSKAYKSKKALHERIVYDFSEENIKVKGGTFSSVTEWVNIYKVAEYKKWILIYTGKYSYSPILIENFGNNLEEFKSLVKSKNVKTKFKK